MEPTSSHGADLAGAGLALALGAYALTGTAEMSELGSVFPTTAAVVLILSGLGLALRALLLPPGKAAPAALEWRRALGLAVVLVAWALLLKPLGFLPTTGLGVVAVGLVTWRERLIAFSLALHLVAGAGLILLFFTLFRYVLRVPLP